jgi:hypothetical protein
VIQPITLITAGISLGVLYLRYKSQPANARRSTIRQKFKLGKLLISALVALMAIVFAMQRLGHNIDGDNPEPSMMERIVQFLK